MKNKRAFLILAILVIIFAIGYITNWIPLYQAQKRLNQYQGEAGRFFSLSGAPDGWKVGGADFRQVFITNYDYDAAPRNHYVVPIGGGQIGVSFGKSGAPPKRSGMFWKDIYSLTQEHNCTWLGFPAERIRYTSDSNENTKLIYDEVIVNFDKDNVYATVDLTRRVDTNNETNLLKAFDETLARIIEPTLPPASTTAEAALLHTCQSSIMTP